MNFFTEKIDNIRNTIPNVDYTASKPFKLAAIEPLIKKPKLDPCELANYRPISNLPLMSKIFENVSAQLCSLLQKELCL